MSDRFGAVVTETGAEFRVWAAAHERLSLVLEDGPELAMHPEGDGFFNRRVADVRAGQRYWYRLPAGLRPDPASRFQPEGPLGPSQLVDGRRFPWTDHDWGGAGANHRHVFYEMHIGTFTQEGTWAAAIGRLPHLADLGVTTLEVMPIASFAGRFGWGYDGVYLFAPTHQYGTPDDVRRFVNEAHRLGLAVILDVVYNHFGPVGNFFAEFSPSINGEPGEWGDSINYDGAGSQPVREFMAENAAYWIREFHFDGLRLDAVGALRDTSDEHVVSAICDAARRAAGARPVFIVGECEGQDSRLFKATGRYRDGLDAIWNEDWHHTAVVRLTGRRQAYFTDYRGSAPEFASMARHGFLYQGQYYSWQKHARGGYALGLPAWCFVNFLENHDQVANTGPGDRLYRFTAPADWRALTALLLLGPGLPLLFQGQEFGSSRPFAYFADHEDELAATVEKGRLEFLSQFPNLALPSMQARIPQPGDTQTFKGCKLLDEERTAEGPLLRLHRDLIRLRRQDPVIGQVGTDQVQIEASATSENILLLRYLGPRAHRLLIVNFGDDHQSAMNDPLLAPLPSVGWEMMWSSEQPEYGGRGAIVFPDAGPWLIPGRSATLLGCTRRLRQTDEVS
jgi:maltooligosyltrehalose trehalohydrolase